MARGTVAAGFEEVRAAFAECVPDEEPGGGFAAYVDGALVVDLVGGRRADTGRPWDHDTTCVIASGTKGIVATAMLMLIERGCLDLGAPVAKYWSEFAAGGKAAVRVADVVAHTAGVPGIVAPITRDQLDDPPSIEDELAAQAPIVPVGHATYHALTYGWLCDAQVRRVDGRSVGRFVADEIAGPLGLDLSIGTPPERIARTAPLRPSEDYRTPTPSATPAPADRLTARGRTNASASRS